VTIPLTGFIPKDIRRFIYTTNGAFVLKNPEMFENKDIRNTVTLETYNNFMEEIPF
jgi:hypothetical protein